VPAKNSALIENIAPPGYGGQALDSCSPHFFQFAFIHASFMIARGVLAGISMLWLAVVLRISRTSCIPIWETAVVASDNFKL
jgi:hypothetical protein